MYIGAELAAWRHTAWLGAILRAQNSKHPVHPDRINPYLAELRASGLLDDEPAPRRRPFSLGSFAALELLVDPERRCS